MEFCYHDCLASPHHLIYREELKKDGKKKLLCSWEYCKEPIWGGSFHNCVECGNRPVHYNSSASINHCLDFTEKLEHEVVCNGCDEPLLLGPAYKCSVSSKYCGFFIHKSCAGLFPEINHPLHPDHTLSLGWFEDERCGACGRFHVGASFYNCDSCGFKLDIKCANHLPTNPNDCHQHEFFPILKRIQFNCEACGEEIKNIPNLCGICKLFVHGICAGIPRIVKIVLHNHLLKLIYSLHEINKLDDIMFCRICGDKVDKEYAAYCCQQCSYILHTECLRRFRDQYGESSATSESVPNESVGRATHLIKALDHAEDKGSYLGEIQHFSHKDHKLILCDEEIKDDKLCQGCTELIISVPFYSCAQCNFFLHTRCTKLPTKIEQHRLQGFDTLILLPRATTKSGVFYCFYCSRHHHGFTYKCDPDSCFHMYKHLDVQCGSIPDTLKHEGHQHPLCLAQDSKNRKCKACHMDNKRHVFVCNSCDFILGIRCANLSLVARHKYDSHLLKLTYVAEDNCREYYCLICEEERDRNHWFYYCKECDFPAHPECVIGNYPRIEIGSTYKSEYHEHPLTFVENIKHSSICGGCSSYNDEVALKCSECKFKVHPPRPYYPDCMWKRSERPEERW